MSALNLNALWRATMAIFGAWAFVRPAILRAQAAGATIATVPAKTASPTVAVTLVPAQPIAVPAAIRKSAGRALRPLAAQLAVTAARNVPRGRTSSTKARALPSRKPAAASPRRASVIKPKPVLHVVATKRAPKRRHVWLSTQTRVVAAPVLNVVSLTASRAQRLAGRPSVLKPAARIIRLAA